MGLPRRKENAVTNVYKASSYPSKRDVETLYKPAGRHAVTCLLKLESQTWQTLFTAGLSPSRAVIQLICTFRSLVRRGLTFGHADGHKADNFEQSESSSPSSSRCKRSKVPQLPCSRASLRSYPTARIASCCSQARSSAEATLSSLKRDSHIICAS